ncbi:hypothetical protein ES703_46752 [subsurface metagenome]
MSKISFPTASPHILSPISSLFFLSIRHTFKPFFAVNLAAVVPPVPAPTIITSKNLFSIINYNLNNFLRYIIKFFGVKGKLKLKGK